MSNQPELADKPEAAKGERQNAAVPEFLLHATEVMAAVSLACILTLTFMKPERSGSIGLCVFAVALPVLGAARIMMAFRQWQHSLRPLYMMLFGSVVGLIGFCLLIAEASPIAAMIFAVLAFLFAMYIFLSWTEG